MIKVVYDYQVLWQQKYGSVSHYFYNLATYILKCECFDVKVLAGFYTNRYLAKSKLSLVRGAPVPKISKIRAFLRHFSKNISKVWLQVNLPAILHKTFYSLARVLPKRIATVLTVYGFTDEKFYPGSPVIFVESALIQSINGLICISEDTRNDLQRLKIKPGKASIVYERTELADLTVILAIV